MHLIVSVVVRDFELVPAVVFDLAYPVVQSEVEAEFFECFGVNWVGRETVLETTEHLCCGDGRTQVMIVEM